MDIYDKTFFIKGRAMLKGERGNGQIYMEKRGKDIIGGMDGEWEQEN